MNVIFYQKRMRLLFCLRFKSSSSYLYLLLPDCISTCSVFVSFSCSLALLTLHDKHHLLNSPFYPYLLESPNTLALDHLCSDPVSECPILSNPQLNISHYITCIIISISYISHGEIHISTQSRTMKFYMGVSICEYTKTRSLVALEEMVKGAGRLCCSRKYLFRGSGITLCRYFEAEISE